MTKSTVPPIYNTVEERVYEEIEPKEDPTYSVIPLPSEAGTSNSKDIGLNICSASVPEVTMNTTSAINHTAEEYEYEEMEPTEDLTYYNLSVPSGASTSKSEDIELNICSAYGLMSPHQASDIRENVEEDSIYVT